MHRHARHWSRKLTLLYLLPLLLLHFLPLSTHAAPFHLLITEEDLEFDDTTASKDNSDNFDDSPVFKSENELDPGSWRPIFEFDSPSHTNLEEAQYYSAVRKMFSAATSGDASLMEEAGAEFEAITEHGGSFSPHAQSVLGFLFGTGQYRKKNEAKAFLYHHFASQGGNMQSKLALAYSYYRQNMYDEAVELYAELAEMAVSKFLIAEDPVIEVIRIHSGMEENKEGLRRYRGEDDEEFQAREYQAQKGNAGAMYELGLRYYFGLRGVRRDYAKASAWFWKAARRGDPLSMEVLGEAYARGSGVERNYTKAFGLLTFASRKQHLSAYNGLGYLYLKGYGVEKNHTKAIEHFKKAKEHGGYYNLGVMHLKGISVKKNITIARKLFIKAAMYGQTKAYFQLAKMFQTGEGLRRDLIKATEIYKRVAEQGPWSWLSRYALESYTKGEVGKALLLYSRLAELGYEVGQSNAAWILDKYGENNICFGELGFCTEKERHERTHALRWQAWKQGNEEAVLLIGDAYYYGRGTEVDYVGAAEACMHARSRKNAQAMFNLGYMHEHGHGLELDLNLAKRYYDEALKTSPEAKFPVTLALIGLWIRRNYPNGFLIKFIDSLPQVCSRGEAWIRNVVMDEGNAMIFALFVCLLTVLYLRERKRTRHAARA